MKSLYRPKLHFTPAKNWMNDPNGLVYDAYTKEYHLFFQYCASLSEDQSQKYWGHAVSEDLVHWKELAPAIEPDSLGGIWSGSCVIDSRNTSGFFDSSTPPASRMVAIFTYALGDETYGWQKQAIAYSKDHGRTWIKYKYNPVIKGKDGDTILYDNRDPKVFWYSDEKSENGGVWVMIIAGLQARIFTSENLRDWTFQGDVMYPDGRRHLESECPDLFPMLLDGREDQVKWVYTGGGRFCVIGELIYESGGRFVFKAETEQISPIVGCDDMYAAQSFFNDPKGRRIGIYWMIDKTADKLSEYGKIWDGYQSLPLEYKLVSTQHGPRLRMEPVEEIAAARNEKMIYFADGIKVDSMPVCLMKDTKDMVLDIEAVVDIQNCDGFEIALRAIDNQKILVGYSKKKQKLYLDRNASGRVASGIYEMQLNPTNEGRIKLRIILDTSVIDVFANNAEAMFNAVVFPEKISGAIQLRAEGGTAILEKIQIYSF